MAGTLVNAKPGAARNDRMRNVCITDNAPHNHNNQMSQTLS